MSLMVTRTQGSCVGSSQALFCWCYASPTRSFVPQRESVSWQDRAQLHNHSNSCSPPYYPYFSFLTFNLVMHTFLRSFLWGVIGKQFFFFVSTKTFSFSVFWDIYSQTANTGSKSFVLWSPENICNTEGSNSSVSRNKMVHDQSHTQCREQKKSIIMKYHVSAVPLEGMQSQGKFSPSRGYSRNPSCLVLDCCYEHLLVLNQITCHVCI